MALFSFLPALHLAQIYHLRRRARHAR